MPEGWRAHINIPNYIYPPSIGMIYPIPTHIFNWHIFLKLLAEHIQCKYTFSKNVHSLTLRLKGTQKPSNLHSSPKCWHDIPNIHTYIQLTYIPQTVGSIYPIQIYISKNVNPPTLCPKGTHKYYKLHLSPKCCHDISNTNTNIQLTYIPKIFGSTYPMQIHIFKNVHSLTLWFFIIFHCAWHDISDINIYIQLTYTP